MTAWQEAVEEAGSPQAIHKSASSASPPLRKDHVDKVLLEIVAGVSPKLVDEPLVERFVDWPPRSPLPHDFEIELPEVRLVVRDGELVHPRSPHVVPASSLVELHKHIVVEQQVRPGEEDVPVSM